MKILIINNSTFTKNTNNYFIEPGMGNFVNQLKNLGNNVIFFGQHTSYSETSPNVFNLNKHNIKVVSSKILRNKLINYILLYLKLIPEIIHSDFVYIFYPSSFRHSVYIIKLFRKKYGLYVRGDIGVKSPFSQYLYKSAYVAFTVSDIFTDYINELTSRNIAFTIKPMLDFDYSDIIYDRDYSVKSKYNLLYFGRITDAKGVEELIYAMSLLIQKKINIHLTIVGSGQYFEEVFNLSNKLNLSEHISFEGSVYDPIRKKEYFKNADIFILPSYNEGFPRSIYESMVFGTPIITTFVGGIPSIMKDNFNALKIDVKSVDSIVEVVIDAINNYDIKMRSIARNATNLISSLLSKDKLSHAKSLHLQILKINK